MIPQSGSDRQDLKEPVQLVSGKSAPWVRWLRRVGGGMVTALLLLTILTPTGCYVSRAAYEEARILARRQPIEKLVARDNTNPVLRARLELVLKARQYAVDSLGLKAGRSFTAYSQLDRDTLVLVVSAAYPDRLKLKTWSFPIVGSFPYKGFFNFEEAMRTAQKLRDEGYDVSVGASGAFSTLGWFDDPLVSTTVKQDSVTLVNTVLHELLHNTYFAKGQVSFNETFASFVGGRGAEQFFEFLGDSVLVKQAQLDWADDLLLAAFWGNTARAIDSVFDALPDSARSERIAARNAVYEAAQKRLVDSIAPMLHGYPPGWASKVKLNNAVLLARRVYSDRLDRFDSVYVASGSNLKVAIQRIISMHSDSVKAAGRGDK